MKIKTIHSRVVHTIVTDLLAPVLLGQDARQI